MISCSYLKNYNFFNIFFQIIIFLIILYLWFKVISIEATVFLLDQKLKKDNNTKASCVSGTCSIPLNNNYESFNTFPMDDMIMKEVFNYCEQPEEQEPTHSINLPVAEHVNIVIEDNDNNEILQQKDEIKKNDVFDLKKDENDNVSVNSNLTKKKLNKLNLEGLKQKCVELNLQADGSKNDLIERILNNDS